MIPPLPPPTFRVSAAKALQMLGLTAASVIDFGDANCYAGTGQTVSDLSGNGNDWQLGNTSGADATDPTFVGTAGALTQNEAAQFDGGDYLTPAGTPTFDDAMHHDNAQITMLAIFKTATLGVNRTIFGNSDSGTAQGVKIAVSATNFFFVSVNNGSGAALAATTGLAMSVATGSWHFLAASVNEAAGAGGSHQWVNGRQTFDGTYTTPGSGAANNAPQIGARGGTSTTQILPNGDKVSIKIVNPTVAWSQGQIAAFRFTMKGRYPSI